MAESRLSRTTHSSCDPTPTAARVRPPTRLWCWRTLAMRPRMRPPQRHGPSRWRLFPVQDCHGYSLRQAAQSAARPITRCGMLPDGQPGASHGHAAHAASDGCVMPPHRHQKPGVCVAERELISDRQHFPVAGVVSRFRECRPFEAAKKKKNVTTLDLFYVSIKTIWLKEK